ncbi:MAG: peptidoglycan-binding protein [Alphaproteobacteria bacterium]|nr:peptidoglycan-binding protein [Alphaproteobacteria bacterium]
MFEPFSLRSTVSESSNLFEDDILQTKSALNRLGYLTQSRHKNDDGSPASPVNGFASRDMIDATKAFQKAEGLRVDGIIKPDGETSQRINQRLGGLQAVDTPTTPQVTPAIRDLFKATQRRLAEASRQQMPDVQTLQPDLQASRGFDDLGGTLTDRPPVDHGQLRNRPPSPGDARNMPYRPEEDMGQAVPLPWHPDMDRPEYKQWVSDQNKSDGGSSPKDGSGDAPSNGPDTAPNPPAEDGQAPGHYQTPAQRRDARHGKGGDKTFLETIGGHIPTDLKADALELGGRLTGRDQAARALDHYRIGGGKNLDMPAEWLRSHPKIQEAETKNRDNSGNAFINDPKTNAQLRALANGQSVTLPFEQLNKDIKIDDGSDHHYTSGKSNLESKGEITFTRKGDRLIGSGKANHNWYDRYDWQMGTKFLKGAVTGDEMADLETQGKAKSFLMRGGWTSGYRVEIPIKANGELGDPVWK